jgi:hypothetical protein
MASYKKTLSFLCFLLQFIVAKSHKVSAPAGKNSADTARENDLLKNAPDKVLPLLL